MELLELWLRVGTTWGSSKLIRFVSVHLVLILLYDMLTANNENPDCY